MRKFVCAIIILAIAQPSFSQAKAPQAPQKLVEVAPESEKFSADRLQRIDHMIKGYIDNGEMNGAATLIARDGKIVYYRAFGYDDREAKKPLKRDQIFRIASQTKAITSVAVMMLWGLGRALFKAATWTPGKDSAAS